MDPLADPSTLGGHGGWKELLPYAVGAACAQALAELVEQGVALERSVVASSSGGTQAGPVVGARLFGYRGRITRICIDQPADALRETVAELATQTAALLGGHLSIEP